MELCDVIRFVWRCVNSMVVKLAEILGITVPVQFEPVLVLVSAMLLTLLVAYFAEILKLIIFRGRM